MQSISRKQAKRQSRFQNRFMMLKMQHTYQHAKMFSCFRSSNSDAKLLYSTTGPGLSSLTCVTFVLKDHHTDEQCQEQSSTLTRPTCSCCKFHVPHVHKNNLSHKEIYFIFFCTLAGFMSISVFNFLMCVHIPGS